RTSGHSASTAMAKRIDVSSSGGRPSLSSPTAGNDRPTMSAHNNMPGWALLLLGVGSVVGGVFMCVCSAGPTLPDARCIRQLGMHHGLDLSTTQAIPTTY